MPKLIETKEISPIVTRTKLVAFIASMEAKVFESRVLILNLKPFLYRIGISSTFEENLQYTFQQRLKGF